MKAWYSSPESGKSVAATKRSNLNCWPSSSKLFGKWAATKALWPLSSFGRPFWLFSNLAFSSACWATWRCFSRRLERTVDSTSPVNARAISSAVGSLGTAARVLSFRSLSVVRAGERKMRSLWAWRAMSERPTRTTLLE